jgi:hypothetical protein
MALYIKTKETQQQLEQQLRAHPMVADRLRHKGYMFVAEAAVKHFVHGERFPVNTWAGSATAQQVKIAYDELTKKK